MPSLSSTWTNFRPPKAKFLDNDVPDLRGKVYIVTGSNTGIGKELTQILYAKNAKVYVACRSEEKAQKAIKDIQNAVPGSAGSLIFLHLDLNDLANVKAAAQTFVSQETKLNVLFNNAGTMGSPAEPPATTKQGYELTLGVNCIGTFLFTKLVTPVIQATAKTEPQGTVRVVWLSSFGLELFAAPKIGISLDNLDYKKPVPATDRYGISKCGAWCLGVEYARRYKNDGIVSVAINPGNLSSELAREQGFALKAVVKLVCYPPINGAFTELYAGFSPEAAVEKPDQWIVPFGRFYPLREDLPQAAKLESEGGTGGAHKFYEWTEEQVKSYL